MCREEDFASTIALASCRIFKDNLQHIVTLNRTWEILYDNIKMLVPSAVE